MADLQHLIRPAVDDAQALRVAGPELLALALMEARNRTLGWLDVLQGLDIPPDSGAAGYPQAEPVAWLAGHAGWFQERWTSRHLQRGRGAADQELSAQAPRLASVDPLADEWFDPGLSSRGARQRMAWDMDAVRGYLAATLDATLALLERCPHEDARLHGFRLALAHEDRIGEQLAAQALAVELPEECWQQAQATGLVTPAPLLSPRPGLGLGGGTVNLGSAPGGWVPEAERWAHPVGVAPFDIDAQPVSWAQWAEFAGDGGYDEPQWWTAAGWRWLQAWRGQRRAPRHVLQLQGAVLARRHGRRLRLPPQQPALHLSRHEAQAWCRWAGRRLPTEAEWELAAQQGQGRGFVWGQALEWVMDCAAPYPSASGAGAGTGPSALPVAVLDVLPAADPATEGCWVLRGGSALASRRLCHPKSRRYAPAWQDGLATGFRSCAL